jgi:small neutral amino acid transporter SnatA (MarC family)
VLGLSLTRSHLADSLPPGASAAAVSVLDTLTQSLRQMVRVVVALVLVMVLVALVVGPSRGARRVRSLAVAGWDGARGGMDRAAGTPLAIPVAIGVAVLSVLVVVFVGDLGTGWTIVLAVVATLGLVVALLMSRTPALDRTDPAPDVRAPAAGA